MSENNRTPEPDTWALEDRLDLELIRKGVEEAKRYHALHQYLGWMINKKYSKIAAKKELVEWNLKNHPPLLSSDLDKEFEKCWSEWAKPAHT
jgi:hypothetical protein